MAGDAERVRALLFREDDAFEPPEPELLGVVAPFLRGELLERAAMVIGYALYTRSRERPLGTELLDAARAVALRVAGEDREAPDLGYQVEQVFEDQLQPVARPVWESAVELAHVAGRWHDLAPSALAPWLIPDLREAARAAESSRRPGLYAALLARPDVSLSEAEEAAEIARTLPPGPQAVLLAWCSLLYESPDNDEALVAALDEVVRSGRPEDAAEVLAAVGLTAADALTPMVAGRTRELLTIPAYWRDVGLVAEWLERALSEPPPERVRWLEVRDQLPAALEALERDEQDNLLWELVGRVLGRWAGAGPPQVATVQVFESEPEREPEPESAPEPQAEPPPAPAPAPKTQSARRRWGVPGIAGAVREMLGGITGRSGPGAAPPEEYELEEVLPGAPPPRLPPVPRYLNAAIAASSRRRLGATMTLEPKTSYLLRLDIGPRAETSIVVGRKPFDTRDLLPDTPDGYWLDVAVVSSQLDVEPRIHRLFLPIVGSSWVCDCEGPEHHCSLQERQGYLDIPFSTRSETGLAALRCVVYHHNNVVQSLRADLVVADGEESPHAQRAVVDYTLSSEFAGIDEWKPRRVNILTNEAADGTHTIVVKGDARVIPVDLTEVSTSKILHELRSQLELITLGKDGASPRVKKRDELVRDLEKLALLGSVFWQKVMPGGDDRDHLRELLRQRATIQVARVRNVVFPWAFVYDIPHVLADPWAPCQLLADWEQGRAQLANYPATCPHEADHGLNTLCPYGLWGFRHLIEQPPSVRGVLKTSIPVAHGARAAIVRSLRLDPKVTAAHLAKLHQCLDGHLTVADCDSAAELLAAIKDPGLPIVYFYCHGRTAVLANTELEQPYLEIGNDEIVAPGDFGAWADAGKWSRKNWVDVPPLVFINGCHTAGLSPEDVVNFVEALAGMDAAGVVGTEISVAQPVASEIGARFYGYFVGDTLSVGEALHRTRLDLLAACDVSGLVYTPFCSMDLALAT